MIVTKSATLFTRIMIIVSTSTTMTMTTTVMMRMTLGVAAEPESQAELLSASSDSRSPVILCPSKLPQGEYQGERLQWKLRHTGMDIILPNPEGITRRDPCFNSVPYSECQNGCSTLYLQALAFSSKGSEVWAPVLSAFLTGLLWVYMDSQLTAHARGP